VAAVTVLVTVLSLAALMALSARRFDESLHHRADGTLRFLAESLRLPLWSLDTQTAATIGAAIAQDEFVSRLEILGVRGEVVFHHDRGEAVAFERSMPVFYEERPIGEIRLGVSALPGRRFLGSVAVVAGISAVLVVALQLLLIGPLLRRQLRAPFEALNATIHSYLAGDYDAPRPEIPFSEFSPITDVLTRMGRTVEQQILELRAAEEKYRRIFEKAPVGIFRTTPEGRVVDVNPAWLGFLGYESREDALAPLADIGQVYADPAERDAMIAILERDGRVVRREVRMRRKDGSLMWASISAEAVFDSEGRLVLIEGLADDVTESRQMQELMIQTEKTLSVGGLAAGMAHELNNPLGIILQSLQNLERRLSPELAANASAAREAGVDLGAVARYLELRSISSQLEAIREAGERAAAIIRTMLEFSRSGDSRRTLCSLAEIVDTALDLAAKDYDLRRKFDFRDIRVTRELDPSTPDVPCAAGEIVQVVFNIVKNAAEALVERGETVAEPRIELRTLRDGDFARLEIRDNGPGMDAGTRRRVFEPYFSTKGRSGGTGLGLSVAYFIVTQRHGGTISVDSTSGQGTAFVIRLPVSGAGRRASEETAAAGGIG
jgi:PAS domain S-box-containing protein